MGPAAGHHHFAGFWSRAAARIIDLLIIIAAFNLIYLVDRLGADAGLWTGMELGEGNWTGAGFSMANVLRGLFFLTFPVFYYVYLHAMYGQTFGKMAMKIKVVNEDETPLDYRKSFLRWLGYFLCDLTFYIGYLGRLRSPQAGAARQGVQNRRRADRRAVPASRGGGAGSPDRSFSTRTGVP